VQLRYLQIQEFRIDEAQALSVTLGNPADFDSVISCAEINVQAEVGNLMIQLNTLAVFFELIELLFRLASIDAAMPDLSGLIGLQLEAAIEACESIATLLRQIRDSIPIP
jgi:hypothetical protein